MPASRHTFDDLLAMDTAELQAIVDRGLPVDPDGVAGKQYLGVDLGMPTWFHRWMWQTFRKTFHRDPDTGVVRGWNVRVEQTGHDGPTVPRTRAGKPWTFAHYELRSAEGLAFPRGWRGGSYLEYRGLGNALGEGFAATPLVAVNEGDMSLLVGWEVFCVGGVWIPLRDHWVLREEGPLEEVVAAPGR